MDKFKDINPQNLFRSERNIPNDPILQRTLLENMPGCFFQFYVRDNGEFGFYYFSNKTDVICGMNWDEPDFFDHIISFIPSENKDSIIQSIKTAAVQLSPWSHEFTLTGSEEKTHYIRISAKPERRDEEVLFNGLVLDISEHSLALNALAASEEKFQAIVGNAEEIIHVLDWEGNFLFISPSWERITGFPVSGTVGSSFTPYVHPDDANRCLEFLDSVHRTGQPHKLLEFRVRHASGEWVWFTNSGVVIKDEHGNPVNFLGVAMDITERRRAENALAANESRLRAIVDNAEEIIYTLDWEGNFLYLSAAWEHITGKKTDETVDRNFSSFIHPEDKPVFMELLNIVHQTGLPRRGAEFRIGDSEGSWVWVSTTGAAIKDAHGTPLYFVGIAMDITDRRRKMEQMQKFESLGVLAGGIAHDFNNLLMAISGNAEIVLNKLDSNSILQTKVAKIAQAAQRASGLCQQMLAYAGKGRLSNEVLDLGEIITEMLDLMEASISKKIKLLLYLDPELPKIEGDATQVRQIILNLITNASEAIGSKEGNITIKTGIADNQTVIPNIGTLCESGHEGEWIFLEVVDSGCGMDDKTKARMFEPFFTTKFTGRGLGMSAVQGITRSHKGYIIVESSPDSGTTFRLFFPATDKIAEDNYIQSDTPARVVSGHGRVLLVDDEEDIRLVATDMLESLGYEVLKAVDGREALDIFRLQAGSIDIVLLDMTMPRMDGRETLEALRDIDSDVPVLISSGYAEADIAMKLSDLNPSGILHKPYTFKSLSESLRSALNIK